MLRNAALQTQRDSVTVWEILLFVNIEPNRFGPPPLQGIVGA